jgi:hypothetical protein
MVLKFDIADVDAMAAVGGMESIVIILRIPDNDDAAPSVEFNKVSVLDVDAIAAVWSVSSKAAISPILADDDEASMVEFKLAVGVLTGVIISGKSASFYENKSMFILKYTILINDSEYMHRQVEEIGALNPYVFVSEE